jgi:glycosyltransferase involved in cell wall biosynthesis
MAALLRRGRSDLFLLVVGDGPARVKIEAAASRLGLEGRVRFTGVVAREDLPAWVGLFHIAVIPAINEYASPLKLFDTMAAGVPAVAPDQPNLREVVGHGREALLFRPGDSAALAEAIERLAAGPTLREEMGRNARARILDDDRTWSGNARRIVEEFVASRAAR